MNDSDIREFLSKKTELFGHFDEGELSEILSAAKTVTFEPDEAIIEFDETGQFFCVILEGEAKACLTDDGGAEHILLRLGPGDTFGEGALMTGRQTAADVIGVTRCRALLFSQQLFSERIITNPGALRYLVGLTADRAKQLGEFEQQHTGRALPDGRDPFDLSALAETPHRILVINCGSSSLKYRLFDTDNPGLESGGTVERIGEDAPLHRPSDAAPIPLPAGTDHEGAFEAVAAYLVEQGTIASVTDISAVGHRVVHGGERFTHSLCVTDEVLAGIESLGALAPLHNPVNAAGIRAAKKAFPLATHTAVFDTSFHHTLPSYAYLYGLPYDYYEKKGVRRYGFHGTSHSYVALRAAQFLGRPYNSLEVITCHLGSGASLCAVDHGRSVDTSMGMTPTAGLLMGTRCGDLDPGALAFLLREDGLPADAIDSLLNRKSGLLGLSGLSNDMRELEAAAAEGHGRALLAVKTFCYQIRKHIGAYTAAMQGLDCVVFTGGIGENSAGIRSLACQGLDCMGIVLDEEKNRAASAAAAPEEISAADSRVKILVVPTDEERMIARETLQAISRERAQHDLESAEARQVPIEVSAHHVHLTAEHTAALFGAGHTLTPAAPLSQPGQFACEEKVTLVGPKGRVERVRVLGPERSQSQVEIAMTEQFKLGIHPPIRESGDIEDTPGIVLEGPAGSVSLERGVICAQRHIHMTPADAIRLGLRDRYVVRVVVPGDRELVFGDVTVRVDPSYALAMHIDTDEGNAANISTGTLGVIQGIQSR